MCMCIFANANVFFSRNADFCRGNFFYFTVMITTTLHANKESLEIFFKKNIMKLKATLVV